MLTGRTAERVRKAMETAPVSDNGEMQLSLDKWLARQLRVNASRVRPQIQFDNSIAEDEVDMGDVATELAAEIAKCLSHEIVDNGIGAYEFWGQRGVDHRWEPEIETGSVWVQFPANMAIIPTKVKGTYEGGGCDGEHRGRCTRQCAEVTVEFAATLFQLIPGDKGTFVAEYSIEQD